MEKTHEFRNTIKFKTVIIVGIRKPIPSGNLVVLQHFPI